MCNAAEHAFKEKSAKLLILLPLRTIYFYSFQCETPCSKLPGQKYFCWNFVQTNFSEGHFEINCPLVALMVFSTSPIGKTEVIRILVEGADIFI